MVVNAEPKVPVITALPLSPTRNSLRLVAPFNNNAVVNVCVCMVFHEPSPFTCLDGDVAIIAFDALSNDTVYVPKPESVNQLAVTDVITKLLFAVNGGIQIGAVWTVEKEEVYDIGCPVLL
jgi:hypothetical protein